MKSNDSTVNTKRPNKYTQHLFFWLGKLIANLVIFYIKFVFISDRVHKPVVFSGQQLHKTRS